MEEKRADMEILDYTYLNDLVLKAQRGSSNAFAELFAVTYQGQYDYSCTLLKDVSLAREALQESFVRALKGLSRLQDPALFLLWLNQINFHVCSEIRKKRGQEQEDAAGGRSQHRDQDAGSGADPYSPPLPDFTFAKRAGTENYALDMGDVADILEKVFRECGRRPNSVPIEAISAYKIQPKERFVPQRRFLAVLLVLLFLLPVFFIDPGFTVRAVEAGAGELPVYVIEVSSLLPVRRVTAQIRGRNLPVFRSGTRKYTVEPSAGGEMEIEVMLLNYQKSTATMEVSAAAFSAEEGIVIEEPGVPLAFPENAGPRHAFMMGLLLLCAVGYSIYFDRYEKKLFELRREAARAQKRAET